MGAAVGHDLDGLTRDVARRAGLPIVLALGAACAPAPAPATREPEPAPRAEPAPEPEPAPAPDARAGEVTPDAGAPDAPPAAPPLGSTAEQFRCGQAQCKSGGETCCGAGDRGVCLPSSPYDAPQGKVGYLKTQWEACDKAALERTGYSLSNIDRCDESLDCAKGQLCCEQFLFSGGTLSECVPARRDGATPCDYGERCIESATCRLPGTQCIDGTCQKPVPKLRCGDTPCSGSTPLCCGVTQSCASKCEAWHQVRCARHADCLSGQRCAVSGWGSACLSLIQDRESQQLVCQLSGECNFKCSDGGRPRCKASALPWIKTCQCS